jgi:hypothetical protein
MYSAGAAPGTAARLLLVGASGNSTVILSVEAVETRCSGGGTVNGLFCLFDCLWCRFLVWFAWLRVSALHHRQTVASTRDTPCHVLARAEARRGAGGAVAGRGGPLRRAPARAAPATRRGGAARRARLRGREGRRGGRRDARAHEPAGRVGADGAAGHQHQCVDGRSGAANAAAKPPPWDGRYGCAAAVAHPSFTGIGLDSISTVSTATSESRVRDPVQVRLRLLTTHTGDGGTAPYDGADQHRS